MDVPLKPFWRYYGAKWRAARSYPAPEHATIVEPFAGAAGYSLQGLQERHRTHRWHRHGAHAHTALHVVLGCVPRIESHARHVRLGNGVVPHAAAFAFAVLWDRLHGTAIAASD